MRILGLLAAVTVWGQGPAERVTVNLGFRDWGPAVVAGSTVLAGNRTGQGGLFAVDAGTGKLRWAHKPAFNGGTASVSTRPAVGGDVVVVPYAAAYPGAVVALSITSGKELWRGPDPAKGAAVAIGGGMAYVLAKNGGFSALDLATGRERWKVAFSTKRAVCAARPVVRDGVVYVMGEGVEGYFLFALDAATGAERWRYRAEAPYVQAGVCLQQLVVTEDTVYGTGEGRLYAVLRATGKERFAVVVAGRELLDLVEAGGVLAGLTASGLIGLEKASGRTVWTVAGEYRGSLAAAGKVLYFQSGPGAVLRAMDLETRAILWSFSRVTAEKDWPFGTVTPVGDGVWVDSYGVLVKLVF